MGVLPGWGGTARLVRCMPIFRAKEIIFSGRRDYTATEMYEMGLLTRVFKDAEFEERFEEIVSNISSKDPLALRMGKEVINYSAEGGNVEMALALERTGIRWISTRPERQAAREESKKDPEQFLKEQKQRNIESDIKR